MKADSRQRVAEFKGKGWFQWAVTVLWPMARHAAVWIWYRWRVTKEATANTHPQRMSGAYDVRIINGYYFRRSGGCGFSSWLFIIKDDEIAMGRWLAYEYRFLKSSAEMPRIFALFEGARSWSALLCPPQAPRFTPTPRQSGNEKQGNCHTTVPYNAKQSQKPWSGFQGSNPAKRSKQFRQRHISTNINKRTWRMWTFVLSWQYSCISLEMIVRAGKRETGIYSPADT